MTGHLYLHFTSKRNAESIIDSGFLLQSTLFGCVFAARVGGVSAPDVQHSMDTGDKGREVAVLFEVEVIPDDFDLVEVSWDLQVLPIKGAFIITTEDAVSLLDFDQEGYCIEECGICHFCQKMFNLFGEIK